MRLNSPSHSGAKSPVAPVKRKRKPPTSLTVEVLYAVDVPEAAEGAKRVLAQGIAVTGGSLDDKEVRVYVAELDKGFAVTVTTEEIATLIEVEGESLCPACGEVIELLGDRFDHLRHADDCSWNESGWANAVPLDKWVFRP